MLFDVLTVELVRFIIIVGCTVVVDRTVVVEDDVVVVVAVDALIVTIVEGTELNDSGWDALSVTVTFAYMELYWYALGTSHANWFEVVDRPT